MRITTGRPQTPTTYAKRKPLPRDTSTSSSESASDAELPSKKAKHCSPATSPVKVETPLKSKFLSSAKTSSSASAAKYHPDSKSSSATSALSTTKSSLADRATIASNAVPKMPDWLTEDQCFAIVLGKMEASRNFDWFGLSEELEKRGLGGKEGRAKGKKGDTVTGGELREAYNNFILPNIRARRAFWSASSPPTRSSFSEESDTPATPEAKANKAPNLRSKPNGDTNVPKRTAIDPDNKSKSSFALGEEEEFEPGLLLDSDEESQVIKTPARAARKARGAKIKARGKYEEEEINESDE